MARGGGELEAGSVLGERYRIVRSLGRGGMGAVYEAVQQDLGRRVAVKVLHKLLAGDSTHLERFRREAEAAASLGHPNIVQVTDFGIDAGVAYLVMELVEGKTLDELVRESGPLGQARAAGIAIQVLAALDSVHRAGIVHRDLKPSNVMVTRIADLHDHARLLDFGIAKMTEGPGYAKLTATGLLVGTPTYMAPEQVLGAAIDGRTDLYALGAVLYTVLSGKRPIDVGPMGSEVQRVLSVVPEPLASRRQDIDPALDAIVMRALRKEPAERWANALEMADALRPFAAPDRAPPPGLAAPDRAPAAPAAPAAATVAARPAPGVRPAADGAPARTVAASKPAVAAARDGAPTATLDPSVAVSGRSAPELPRTSRARATDRAGMEQPGAVPREIGASVAESRGHAPGSTARAAVRPGWRFFGLWVGGAGCTTVGVVLAVLVLLAALAFVFMLWPVFPLWAANLGLTPAR